MTAERSSDIEKDRESDGEQDDTTDTQEEYPDLRTLRHLHSDLKQSHNEVLATFTDLSQKTGRLLQFNGTILALLVAAGTVDDDITQYINCGVIIGIALILLSILILIVLGNTDPVKAGVGSDERTIAVGKSEEYPPLNESSYLLWATQLYTTWIEDAADKNKNTAQMLRVSEIFTIIGIMCIIGGILNSVLL